MLQDCGICLENNELHAQFSGTTASGVIIAAQINTASEDYITGVPFSRLALLAEVKELRKLPPEAGPMNGKDFLTWLEKN